MIGLPVIFLFVLSFFRIERGIFTSAFTTEAYTSIFKDGFYLEMAFRSLWIAFFVTVLCLLIGYPIAFLFYRAKGRWKGVILLLVLAPLLTSTLVRTFGWMVLLGRAGALNSAMLGLHLVDRPVEFLFTLKGVLIGMTQVLLPYMVLPLMAALETVAPVLEEAATNLGASRWQIFWRIIVPQTLPGVAGGVSLVFILAFSEFPVPALLGGSTFKMLPVYLYQTMATLLDWSRGAALASVLLVGSGLVIYLIQRFFRRVTPWTNAT